MDRAVSLTIIVLAYAFAVRAQTPGPESEPDYFKHNLTATFVYEVKAGSNSGVSIPFLNNAPGFSIDYLFQPRPWLALDAGYAQVVRPIGSKGCCGIGTSADELYLVPFGLRYVWALRTRLHLTAGGGGAYVNHSIGNESVGGFGFAGWGGQFVASGDMALTKSGRLRLGVTARYYFAAPTASAFGIQDHLHIFVFGPGVTFSLR